jgi:glutamate synthase (NADPH/NADH) large chain
VVIETDGKLMSGRDVAIAALLGAEEFGFATAPLVTLGCVMMRVCNLDTCPMGIATQNPELRKRFTGKPEYVMNFMLFIAQQLREYMAKLGVRTVDEMVGRTDLLKKKDFLTGQAAKVDLSLILQGMNEGERKNCVFDPNCAYHFQLEQTKDEAELLKNKEILESVVQGKKSSYQVKLTNTDRTFGTLLGAEVTRHHPSGLPEDTITILCQGAGGQSFGAFLPKGITLSLCGDSNDYFGKGLSGGKLAVYAPPEANFVPEENVIIGNVALYGATGGEAYIAGMAGERFCVRNSGATAVVEGVGEHGCEYMTGGRTAVLGPTGKNFAAGMSGGIAYVLDEGNCLYKNLNKEMVLMEKVETKYDQEELRAMIEAHVAHTNSRKGKEILAHFAQYLPAFKKIIPADYKHLIQLSSQFEEQGMSRQEAQIEAFYAGVSRK